MVKSEIRVAWGEMDAYGHVNNAVFLRWFETVRIEWFEFIAFPEEAGKSGPVLRKATVEYLAPVCYPDTVHITVVPTHIGRTSVTLAYEVTSLAQRTIIATGETVVVLNDFVARKSLALPPDACLRIEAEMSGMRDLELPPSEERLPTEALASRSWGEAADVDPRKENIPR